MGCKKQVAREKQAVHTECREPKGRVAAVRVVHGATQLRQAVVEGGQDGEEGARYEDVVEVGHDEVAIVVLEVRRHDGEHQSREAADREQEQEGQ